MKTHPSIAGLLTVAVASALCAMQSWDSVTVIDESLEHNGRAGKVLSAGPVKGDGVDYAKDRDVVVVQLDPLEGETDPPGELTFAVDQLRRL